MWERGGRGRNLQIFFFFFCGAELFAKRGLGNCCLPARKPLGGGRRDCVSPPGAGRCSAAGLGVSVVVARLRGAFFPKPVCGLGRWILFLHMTPALSSSYGVFWLFFFYFPFFPLFFSCIRMLCRLPGLSEEPRACLCMGNPGRSSPREPAWVKGSGLSHSRGHLARDNSWDLRVQF